MRKTDQINGKIIARFFLLLLGILLFVWPCVLFFESKSIRVIWILSSAAILFISMQTAERALKNEILPPLSWKSLPWAPIIITGVSVLFITLTTPLLSFGSEYLFVLQGLNVANKVLSIIPWFACMILLIVGSVLICKKQYVLNSQNITWSLFACMVLVSIITALNINQVVISRYPPVVHVLQMLSAFISAGDHWSYRFPNVFWTVLSTICIWKMFPWNKMAKWVASIALLTTPIGWFYHATLFQVPGQIFFALLSIALTMRIIEDGEKEKDSAFLGITFILWVLYRETAVASIAGLLAILFLLKKWRSLRTILLIFVPVSATWFALFVPNSDYVATFYMPEMLIERQGSFFYALMTTLSAMTFHLHILGLSILIATTIFVLLYGSKTQKLLLTITWVVSLSQILFHVSVAMPEYAGYGRFDAFIILPLCIGTALLPYIPPIKDRFRSTIAVALITILILVTPWNIARFANNLLNKPVKDIRRMTTLGHLYTRFPEAVRKNIDKANTMIPMGLSSSFLDFYIAEKKITPMERSAMIKRSMDWQPDNPGSPLIVVDPQNFQFSQIDDKEEMERLKRASAWARKQPNVQEYTIYGQTTLVVP